MLPIQDIRSLLNACQTDAPHLRASKTAQRLADNLGFGRVVGQRWLLSAADKQRIRDYLQAVEGIAPDTPADAWRDSDRIAAAGLGANEKLAGRGPRHGRVCLRAPRGLRLPDTTLWLPPGAALDLPVDTPLGSGHDALLLIENFAAFVGFEQASLVAPFENPLLLFRGDGIHPPDAALDFVRRAALPVFVWPDFDPAGLRIAAAVPDCLGIVAPTEPRAALAEHGRTELFLKQHAQIEGAALSGEGADLVEALREFRRGIDQERQIARSIALRSWLLAAINRPG